MRAVVQRCGPASVVVDDETVGSIHSGLLVYLGVARGDGPRDADYLAEKIAHLRIFGDARGRMNLSLLDSGGEALIVSQFTLCADARKGRRPSYDPAAEPDIAEELYRFFIEALKGYGIAVSTGRFGADMQVASVNRGPVTILLDSRKSF